MSVLDAHAVKCDRKITKIARTIMHNTYVHHSVESENTFILLKSTPEKGHAYTIERENDTKHY